MKAIFKKRRRALLLWSAGAVSGAVVATAISAVAAPRNASPYHNLGTFAKALSHIELSYVDEVDQDELIYGAIRGMVTRLDPHSSFMDPSSFRILTSDTEGRFGGIGVEIDIKDGWLTVVNTVQSGPASRAGIREGDQIVMIGERSARGMPIDEAIRRMRGEPGTPVQFRLRRAYDKRILSLNLTREIIRVNAVEARVLPDGILYARLRVFQETTTDELRKSIDAAVAETRNSGGVRGVLLDLRNNPGGLLDEAISVSDEFLSRGVIVTTRGRDGKLLSEARAKLRGTRPTWPIVVLVNGYSASASEIVAGALRDHRRATIVGTKTFGKGSVQNIIELPGGGALKLTIARYYTPTGRSIQAEGIEPDMEIAQLDPAARAGGGIREATLEGHLPNEKRSESVGARPGRGQARSRATVGKGGAAFPGDFQAHMAHQVLRALSANR